MAEGSWNLTKGIFARLRRDGVEQTIKDRYWSHQISDPAKWRAVWKNFAAKGAQLPYVVYSIIADNLTGQSAGAVVGEFVQYRQALVQFRCFCSIGPGKDESVGVAVAQLVADAIENGKLCFSTGTRFITLTRQGDIESRDDEQVSVIAVQYLIEYELIVNLTRLLA